MVTLEDDFPNFNRKYTNSDWENEVEEEFPDKEKNYTGFKLFYAMNNFGTRMSSWLHFDQVMMQFIINKMRHIKHLTTIC